MKSKDKNWIVRPAIAITQNVPEPFYAFSLSASELREIAYVSERTKDNPQEGIERNLSNARCRTIGRYIQRKIAVFPNSIIIALEKTAKFKSANGTGIGTIHIPRKPSQALILDGQHRLYGFDHAKGKDIELLIVAFINVPISLKAHIFRTINGKQKPVNRSLVYDLLDLDTSTAEYEEERAHALVKSLDREEESPFYQNIQMTGKQREGFISQASLITYLKRHLKRGGFFKREEYSSFNRQLALLCDYFKAVRDTFLSHWGKPESIVSKTVGIDAFFRLLPDLVTLIEDDRKKPTYKEFRMRIEPISDLPMDVETYRLYGIGGAIAFYELLKESLGLEKQN